MIAVTTGSWKSIASYIVDLSTKRIRRLGLSLEIGVNQESVRGVRAKTDGLRDDDEIDGLS